MELDELHTALVSVSATILADWLKDSPHRDEIARAVAAGCSVALRVIAPRLQTDRWSVYVELHKPDGTSQVMAGYDTVSCVQ